MNHPSMMEGTKPEKRGPGRPKKEVPKAFNELSEPEQVILTYNDGHGDSAVCRALQISKEEFDERVKEDAAFARLVSFGRTLCRAWWEDRFRAAAMGEKISASSMVNLYMKNVFGWAEKSETDNRDLLGIEGLTRDEALQKLRELGPNIIDLVQMKEQRAASKPI
jgi:hypothetical protein